MNDNIKKSNILPNSIQDVENLETTIDLYQNLFDYEKMIKSENDRKKNKIAKEISIVGDDLLNEIAEKNAEKEIERQSYIKLITKSSNDKYGTYRVLNNMTHEELRSIYNKIEEEKKPWYIKLFELFM